MIAGTELVVFSGTVTEDEKLNIVIRDVELAEETEDSVADMLSDIEDVTPIRLDVLIPRPGFDGLKIVGESSEIVVLLDTVLLDICNVVVVVFSEVVITVTLLAEAGILVEGSMEEAASASNSGNII